MLTVRLVILIVILCFGCSIPRHETCGAGHLIETSGVKLSAAQEKRVLEKIDWGLDIICERLGADRRKIEVFVVILPDGIASSFANVVILPETHLESLHAPIIHELTHVVLKDRKNRFFCEGVATYFQEKYGEKEVFPNFSNASLQTLLRRNDKQMRPITQLIHDNDAFDAAEASVKGRKIAYLQAGSFFWFLVETYGEKSLARLNSQKQLDYEAVYGKPLAVLEKNWESYVLDSKREH